MQCKNIFPLGYYVKEIMEENNITKIELKKDLNLTSEELDNFLEGKRVLSEKETKKLSKITGISFKTLKNLEKSYFKEGVS